MIYDLWRYVICLSSKWSEQHSSSKQTSLALLTQWENLAFKFQIVGQKTGLIRKRTRRLISVAQFPPSTCCCCGSLSNVLRLARSMGSLTPSFWPQIAPTTMDTLRMTRDKTAINPRSSRRLSRIIKKWYRLPLSCHVIFRPKMAK